MSRQTNSGGGRTQVIGMFQVVECSCTLVVFMRVITDVRARASMSNLFHMFKCASLNWR